MKRRRREVNIFNMSTIDLFACSLGAFVLLTLILLPYYLNIDRSYLDVIEELNATIAEKDVELSQLDVEISQLIVQRDGCNADLQVMTQSRDQIRDQAQSAAGQIESLESRLNAATTESAQQREQLGICSDIEKISFMLVLMSWETADDIDLHVVDPAGRRYFFRERRLPGSVAAFEEDNTRGPGNEVWLHPSAVAGEYKIYYNFYRRRTNSDVTVRGTIFHQRGKFELPEMNLSEMLGDNFEGASLAATVVVDNNGNVRLR